MAINTLVTIKDSITAFAEGHGQLQGRVIFEADDHRSAYITEENTYPLLFVAPIDVAVNRAMNVHTLRVYVYERINDDRLDVWENANDTSLILRDIRVWWNDYGVDDINIVEDPIGQFGCDKELDNLVGYFADIRFEIPSHGRCQVPVDVAPIPPSPGCADATQIIINSEGTQLYVNSIPSGATETQLITDSIVNLKDTASNLIGTLIVPAQTNPGIIAPNALLHIKKENDGTITNLSLLSNSSTQYIVDNNDISVNGVLSFDIHATEALDIRLRDTSNAVITPISVTDSGNHATIVLASAPSPRSTATLMKTGQTTSYVANDDGWDEYGRVVNFLTLDAAPLHNNGAATLNTTTNRFTDTLGGQTYTNTIVLDWSTWNGTTLKGYRRTKSSGYQDWSSAMSAVAGLTIGGFTKWRLPNRNELENLINEGVATTCINYSPFNLTTDTNLWTNTTAFNNTANARVMASTGNGNISSFGKTAVAAEFIPTREFSLSTSNVLS